MNKLLIALWLGSNLFLSPKVLAQTFTFEDSVGDAHNIPGHNFEIYNTSWIDLEDKIRIVFDTDMPLSGVQTRLAADGHIGWGDVMITNSSTNTNYGLVFDSNSNNSLGIYEAPGWTSLVEQNYGEPSLYGEPTNIISGTGEKIGDVQVYEFIGEGQGGSNRIAIEFDKGNLPFGDYMIKLIQECANDLITFRTSVGAPAVPDSNGGNTNFTPSGHTSKLGNNIQGLKSNGGNATLGYVLGGVVVVAALILILSGGGANSSQLRTTDSSTAPDNPDSPSNPGIKTIPEPDIAHSLILLSLLSLIIRRRVS